MAVDLLFAILVVFVLLEEKEDLGYYRIYWTD